VEDENGDLPEDDGEEKESSNEEIKDRIVRSSYSVLLGRVPAAPSSYSEDIEYKYTRSYLAVIH
jgi:hypothetical protein